MVEINRSRLPRYISERAKLGMAYVDAFDQNKNLTSLTDLKNNLVNVEPIDTAEWKSMDNYTDKHDVILSDRNVQNEYGVQGRTEEYAGLSDLVERSVVDRDWKAEHMNYPRHFNVIEPEIAFEAGKLYELEDNDSLAQPKSVDRHDYLKAVMLHGLCDDMSESDPDAASKFVHRMCEEHHVDEDLYHSADVAKDAEHVVGEARDDLRDYAMYIQSSALQAAYPDRTSIKWSKDEVSPEAIEAYQGLRQSAINGLRSGLSDEKLDESLDSLGKAMYQTGRSIKNEIDRDDIKDPQIKDVMLHLGGNYAAVKVTDALQNAPQDVVVDAYQSQSVSDLSLIVDYIDDHHVKQNVAANLIGATEGYEDLGQQITEEYGYRYGVDISAVDDALEDINHQMLNTEARKYLSAEDQQTMDNYFDSIKSNEYAAESSHDDLLKGVNVMVDPDSVKSHQLAPDEAKVESKEQSLQHDEDSHKENVKVAKPKKKHRKAKSNDGPEM